MLPPQVLLIALAGAVLYFAGGAVYDAGKAVYHGGVKVEHKVERAGKRAARKVVRVLHPPKD